MKVTVNVQLEPADTQAATEWLLKQQGFVWPAGSAIQYQIMETPVKTPADPVPATATPVLKGASTAPIGQTVEGFKITHYGYPGDSSPDSNSMKGIGDRGNKLTPYLSVALTKSARQKLFNAEDASTGKQFTLGATIFQDDDSAPEPDLRVDVYDPYYAGTDPGCTPEMYAKSKAEMVAAGILS